MLAFFFLLMKSLFSLFFRVYFFFVFKYKKSAGVASRPFGFSSTGYSPPFLKLLFFKNHCRRGNAVLFFSFLLFLYILSGDVSLGRRENRFHFDSGCSRGSWAVRDRQLFAFVNSTALPERLALEFDYYLRCYRERPRLCVRHHPLSAHPLVLSRQVWCLRAPSDGFFFQLSFRNARRSN